MKLIASDAESVTIKFMRREEYTDLMAVLNAYQTELGGLNLDLQLLTIPPSAAKAVIRAFFEISKKVPLS